MKKLKRIIIIIAVTGFAAFFCYRFIMLNNKYPPAEVFAYNIGDAFNKNECEITVSDYEILDFDQLCGKYELEKKDFSESYDEYYYAVVSVDYINNSDKEVNNNIDNVFLYSKSWNNPFDPELYFTINEEKALSECLIQSGESCSIVYAFNFSPDYEKDSSEKYQLIYGVYPKKYIINLE